MDVLVVVSGQRLRIPADARRFVHGTKKFVRFVFNFDKEWDTTSLYAKFKQNDSSIDVALVDKKYAELPDGLSLGYCTVSLWGTSSSGEYALTGEEAIYIYDGKPNTVIPSYGSSSGSSSGSGSTIVDIDFATLEEVKGYLGMNK